MNNEIQQKMMMHQLLERHMGSLKQQAMMLDNRFIELQSAKQAIDDFDKTGDSEIIIPLGAGFFCKGRVVDSKHTLANVGMGIMAEQEAKESLKKIGMIENELETAATNLKQEIDRISENMRKNAMEIQQFQQQENK